MIQNSGPVSVRHSKPVGTTGSGLRTKGNTKGKKREPPQPKLDPPTESERPEFKIIQCDGEGKKRKASPWVERVAPSASLIAEAEDPLKRELEMDEASVADDKTPVVIDKTTAFARAPHLSQFDLYTTLAFWKRLNPDGWYITIQHLIAQLFCEFSKNPWFVVDAAMLRASLPQAMESARKNIGIRWAPNPEGQSILLHLRIYSLHFISRISYRHEHCQNGE